MSTAARPDRPIPNSYWVREGRFAAGEYPGALDPRDAAAKVRALIEAGVDCFVDLTQQRDGLAPYEQIAHEQARALGRSVRRESHPITDMSVPRHAAEMAAILDAIDDALDQGRTVFSPPGSSRRSNYSSSEVGERPPGVPTRLSSVSARATSCSGVDGLSAWSWA